VSEAERTGNTDGRWRHAVAGALMIGGPVWHSLYDAHYPFTRPEAIALPLAAGLAGAAAAVVARVLGGFPGAIVYGGLLFAFADLQFDPQKWTYLLVVLAGCVALAWLLSAYRATITALALGVLYLTSLPRDTIVRRPRKVAAPSPAPSKAPLLVHIILDEQGGAGAMRAAGDTATADFLADFYTTRGFELYEGAYSRFNTTIESVPDAVSLGGEAELHRGRTMRPYWRSMRRIPYFERLHELGYEIRVVQSTYLDYCSADGAPVVSCEVEYGNSIRNIGVLEGSWVRRAVRAGRFLLTMESHIFRKLRPGPQRWRRAVSGGGIAGARRLAAALRRHGRAGTAFFAHLIIPHRPVDVDEECLVVAMGTERLHPDFPESDADPYWPETLRLMGGQSRCAHRQLAAVLAVIDSTVGRDSSIVIVQGDHGMRIHPRPVAKESISAYTASELNAEFATLLAVRRPGVAAAVRTEAVPVQDFVWALARSGFGTIPPQEWEHYVRRLASRRVTDTLRPLTARDMPWARAAR
jgi:hypothetical protein